MTFIWGQFHKRYLSHWPLKSAWKLLIWNLLWMANEIMSFCGIHMRWISKGVPKIVICKMSLKSVYNIKITVTPPRAQQVQPPLTWSLVKFEAPFIRLLFELCIWLVSEICICIHEFNYRGLFYYIRSWLSNHNLYSCLGSNYLSMLFNCDIITHCWNEDMDE